MKDWLPIWSKVTGRRYSAVNTNDRELKDLTNNRLRSYDIDNAGFENNSQECQGLNRFEDIDFSDGKDAIINRLFTQRKKGHVTRQPKCLFFLLMIGFCAIGTGCMILILKPYDFIFEQKVIFSEGGEIFEMWKKPEVDLYVRIYLFNVTNAEAYMAGNDTKLKLKEVGPYVYKEALEHQITSFNTNGTLSAIPLHPLTWMEELSEGHKENDTLYLPNIALLSIANVVAKQSIFSRIGLNHLIKAINAQPLVQMTAKEFMMGHTSALMTLGNTFMPGWIHFDKLGLIDRMYDFKGDYETIFTGEDDMRLSGLIDTYKGSTDLPQWEGKHCSNVQYASDGTKFKGGVSFNESLLFFRKSLCRVAPLIPRDKGTKSSLNGYLYTFPDNLLDNGKYNPDNKCFCRKGKCLPAGLIDVTDCYYGFPIALSYPHFYEGDEILSSKVEGLSPSKELHETRFWIEPKSGLPLEVSSKFQINMALEDISNIVNTEKFTNMYLPLLWFDIKMYSLPQSLETRFRFYLNILPVVEQSGMYIAFFSGIILILFTTYRLAFKIMFRNTKNTWENDKVYSPCVVPLNDNYNSTDSEDNFEKPTQKTVPEKPSFIRTQSERIIELGAKLSDKVQDSVGSVRDKVKTTNVKSIFKDDRDVLVQGERESMVNDAYKSESEEDTYLEVVDDGDDFGFQDDRTEDLFINI